MNFFILYKSRAILPRDINEQTIGIAKASLANNRRDGITGFLHAEHGAFYQYLEGERSAVEALFEKIRADKRHSAVVLIASGHSNTRLFADFDMGFVSADGRQVAERFSEDPDDPPANVIISFLKEARDAASAA
jgi:hypothetical protein